MICEHCHGQPQYPPCLSCGGCGFGHCCEGMVGGPYEEAAQDANFLGTLQTRSGWASQPGEKDHVEGVIQMGRKYQTK